MTAAALKTYIATQLTPPVNQVQRVIDSFNEVVDFITAQQQSEVIPNWTALLEFNTDGSGDGSYAIHPDSNGAIRFWKTKTDTNTGNEPPTNPAVTENDFWIEVSPAGGSAIQEWATGIYGAGLIIVFHNHSSDGPGLYLLAEPERPYESANIETEITAEDWVKITGGVDSSTTRVQTSASAATLNVNADNFDMVVVTAQAEAITIANPTGTPTQGQGLVYRLKDDGTARGISYGADFRALGVTLPTTTTISKTLYLACVYNSTDSKWDVIGYKEQA
jgi:hypothetical protein